MEIERNVFWIYLEYYWLRVRELFSRKMSRKLMWGLYWEATVRVEDLRLRKINSKNRDKEIKKGLELCRKIMQHLIKIEGGIKDEFD